MDTTLQQTEQLQEQLEFIQMFPWLVLVALTIPLIIVARRKVYPYIVYPLALLIPTVLTAGIMLNASWLVPALAADALIFTVSLLDLFTLPSTSALRAERHHNKVASIVKNSNVAFRMINESSRRLRLTLLDDLPETFKVEDSIFRSSIGKHETKEFQYSFKPTKRGQFKLQCIHVRSRSLFGFWVRHLTVPVETQIHVYPDLHQLSHYALLARTNRLNLLGVRRTRKVGQDNEFERLREYTRDDHYRNINWRSTARHNKLIVQDYQNTQSQRIIFLIDCGRMMTNESAEMTFVDHALNSMLMLSHVALSKGDSVGLICFSDKIHCFVPPRSGMSQMNQLLHASFNQFPRMVESRYDEAFLYLANRCNKRALVILITNVVDEVNSQQVVQYMQTVSRRHLPISVMLRDHHIFDEAEQTKSLYNAAAAAQILNWRHDVLNTLTHRGAFAMDVFPEDMTTPIINQYLEIKARHLL
ncbi:MAG: DUF58 domain-containing protein [Planctomycetaceae bacterium]|nr:DUF58 domain-containing protein [Planctomycetaceae bacterium]MBT4013061.1 DUF58 domain-containing protein [Planctomycetaceae bacterium]MBT4726739.1 DUF58 domain-containing protein [Planctomycetaceae bacterium]MBT4846190.1 DUF58 domain-containing protein [Planctomycetaceae bacterium]MBT5123651.1 DUF58 domain-containing protein [Planctomycetaceae bacterium]